MISDDSFREKLYNIIFESDTVPGKAFDILLIVTIISNTILVIAESVESIRVAYKPFLVTMGWIFLIIFTIEYIIRLYVVKRKWAYMLSFFGIIDFLAIIPVFVSFIIPGVRFLAVIRVFRLLRIFSILKMGRYVDESSHLIGALKASRPKITVFLFTILFIIVLVGSLMYIIEGPENGFTDIPISMYWAIVTVSTVGYGDIAPQTSIGKVISSILMITGYGIIAVPTGIISHELAHTSKEKLKTCSNCFSRSKAKDDKFCSNCGNSLD